MSNWSPVYPQCSNLWAVQMHQRCWHKRINQENAFQELVWNSTSDFVVLPRNTLSPNLTHDWFHCHSIIQPQPTNRTLNMHVIKIDTTTPTRHSHIQRPLSRLPSPYSVVFTMSLAFSLNTYAPHCPSQLTTTSLIPTDSAQTTSQRTFSSPLLDVDMSFEPNSTQYAKNSQPLVRELTMLLTVYGAGRFVLSIAKCIPSLSYGQRSSPSSN